jgi:Ca2+-binding EF-hand superfamily protein
MYDLDGDDKISRDELLAVLHMMVGKMSITYLLPKDI